MLEPGFETMNAEHEGVRTTGGSPETNLPMKAVLSIVKFGGRGT